MARMISGIIILSTFIIWIVWDVYAFIHGGEAATLSVIITDFSYYSPALPLIIGMLIDHWFIPEFKPDRLLRKK